MLLLKSFILFFLVCSNFVFSYLFQGYKSCLRYINQVYCINHKSYRLIFLLLHHKEKLANWRITLVLVLVSQLLIISLCKTFTIDTVSYHLDKAAYISSIMVITTVKTHFISFHNSQLITVLTIFYNNNAGSLICFAVGFTQVLQADNTCL